MITPLLTANETLKGQYVSVYCPIEENHNIFSEGWFTDQYLEILVQVMRFFFPLSKPSPRTKTPQEICAEGESCFISLETPVKVKDF